MLKGRQGKGMVGAKLFKYVPRPWHCAMARVIPACSPRGLGLHRHFKNKDGYRQRFTGTVTAYRKEEGEPGLYTVKYTDGDKEDMVRSARASSCAPPPITLPIPHARDAHAHAHAHALAQCPMGARIP